MARPIYIFIHQNGQTAVVTKVKRIQEAWDIGESLYQRRIGYTIEAADGFYQRTFPAYREAVDSYERTVSGQPNT